MSVSSLKELLLVLLVLVLPHGGVEYELFVSWGYPLRFPHRLERVGLSLMRAIV